MKIETDPNVANIIANYPQETRSLATKLRELIIETAKETDGVDTLTETLRWGQPSYISNIGTALRIAPHKSGDCALFAHCQSSIISNLAATFDDAFAIDGNRAVVFKDGEDLQKEKLRMMIRNALTYKRS